MMRTNVWFPAIADLFGKGVDIDWRLRELDAFIEAFSAPDVDMDVRARALFHFEEMDAASQLFLVPHLCALLANNSFSIRWRAAEAIERLGTSDTTDISQRLNTYVSRPTRGELD